MKFIECCGVCPCCKEEVTFTSDYSWLRDHFLCSNCGSIPRERALMYVLERHYPSWPTLTIHESSPGGRGASPTLARGCAGYIGSQYYPDQSLGSICREFRCENLERLTFSDNSIDLHISQDVMEHVFDPVAAFREIGRTLKPGGAHIFTTPIVLKHLPTTVRARLDEGGGVVHLESPVYHGNPIDSTGALVTFDWGFDITSLIFTASGLFTDTLIIDDLSRGIRAEYIEVFVTSKPMEIAE